MLSHILWSGAIHTTAGLTWLPYETDITTWMLESMIHFNRFYLKTEKDGANSPTSTRSPWDGGDPSKERWKALNRWAWNKKARSRWSEAPSAGRSLASGSRRNSPVLRRTKWFTPTGCFSSFPVGQGCHLEGCLKAGSLATGISLFREHHKRLKESIKEKRGGKMGAKAGFNGLIVSFV